MNKAKLTWIVIKGLIWTALFSFIYLKLAYLSFPHILGHGVDMPSRLLYAAILVVSTFVLVVLFGNIYHDLKWGIIMNKYERKKAVYDETTRQALQDLRDDP